MYTNANTYIRTSDAQHTNTYVYIYKYIHTYIHTAAKHRSLQRTTTMKHTTRLRYARTKAGLVHLLDLFIFRIL